ncbi:MAG: hypothetical protein ACI4W6_07195, partial [Acutalibacteraceae bacterium]
MRGAVLFFVFCIDKRTVKSYTCRKSILGKHRLHAHGGHRPHADAGQEAVSFYNYAAAGTEHKQEQIFCQAFLQKSLWGQGAKP